MMTEQRKKRLRDKIQESRERLMETRPYFAILLMYLKFVAVPDMNKISTNGRCIYFSPNFVDKLYCDELDYILCHQIMHIICEHIWREYAFVGDDYHFACDILINDILSSYDFNEERYAHLGYIHRTIPGIETKPSELTPKEIYDSIPYSLYALDERTRSKFLPDSDIWWDRKDDNGFSGELILDVYVLDGMLKEGTEEELVSELSSGGDGLQGVWQELTGIVATSMMDSTEENRDTDVEPTSKSDSEKENHNTKEGDVPDFVKRMVTKMQKPTLDWKKILNNFVQERICDYSFSPPDRRYSDSDFFLPDFNEKEFISKEILFMVDTSGSVKDDELAIVYSEICGAIEHFDGKLTAKLGFFNVGITPPIPFDTISGLMKIVPYGGGGTDFRCIFEYIRRSYKNELPACVVIFTDGYGPYPDETEAMGIPVLWIINNSEITPPWGKITRIVPDEKVNIPSI